MEYDKYIVVKASGLILMVMNLLGMTGWTSVWGKIYIRADQMSNQRLRRHEQVHAMQIQRDGWVLQPLKYLWYTIRHGYKQNPYEVEARELQSSPNFQFKGNKIIYIK